MVASDTVVGIVGAVVLVGVMAAVFVYEYNNPADEAALDPAEEFAAHYSALDASEDLDMDGTANAIDGDLDGDGVNNTEDPDVGYSTDASGSRGQLLPGSTDAGQSFPIFIGSGNTHTIATITYSRTAAPLGGVGTPTFAAELRDETGAAVATGAVTGTSQVTITVEAVDNLPAGNYTLVVRQTQPGAGGSFTGTLEVHYEAPMALDDHTH